MSGLSPRSYRTLRAILPQTHEHAALDAMHAVAITLPSTVAEQLELVIRDHVPANAPGRIEGRRERRHRAVTSILE